MPNYDNSVPVFILKIGAYPFSHGTLGAIRSLGRLGIPVYAVVEDNFVPYAFSRFLKEAIFFPTSASQHPEEIKKRLRVFGSQFRRPAILLPTDDEAAIFCAENISDLGSMFIASKVAPDLPRLLASKRDLSIKCLENNVPTPLTAFGSSAHEIMSAADKLMFPLVIKNSDPWTRITSPAVASTTIIHTRDELEGMVRRWINPVG